MAEETPKEESTTRAVDQARRTLLKAGAISAVALGAGLAGGSLVGLRLLRPAVNVPNPLDAYPDRNWEQIYRDQYRYDSTFTFVCAPNDTHNCRLRAFVRNGVIVRTEQAYDVDTYTDLYGTRISPNWHPRGCLKGYTITRRLYGPYRIKAPVVRSGWKAWAEADFPDPTAPGNRELYFKRGQDSWVQVSWEEASTLAAKGLLHLMASYGGAEGAARLAAQGYPAAMIEAMHGSGAQTIKLRAGMPLHGITRIHGLYRLANTLALYDGQYGARGWSNYDWHGDLPPGHPMVTGVQTFDVDMPDFRSAKLLVFLGKNMVENKMADAHWWVEGMERGMKIVNVSPEYSPASQKADYWIPVRPGTDTALLLGVANLIIQAAGYDAAFVKQYTDLPLLVRMDTRKLLRATDIFPGYVNPPWTGYSVTTQKIPAAFRDEWGDFVIWDAASSQPAAITREDVGANLVARGLDPVLEGSFTVGLVAGGTVEVRPLFQLYKELCAEYDLQTASEITQAPAALIQQLATDFMTIRPAQLHTGEGVNHYFHCDQATRAVFLVTALTGNIGRPGAGVGHWAGNYKSAIFDGLPVYNAEDPFASSLDPAAPGTSIAVKKYWKGENPAYWNYEERPLEVNGQMLTGTTHMPTPTKAIWTANVNLLNNAKWAYNMLAAVDPKVELVIVNDWEWTSSCEYADIVFPVQSWVELSMPDMTASCSNPFIQLWKGGIAPMFDDRQDAEAYAGVARALSALTGDPRYADHWKFASEGRMEVYLQRVLDASSTTAGYTVQQMLDSDRGWLAMFRTYPRIPGYEQIQESKPFYNKTGRLELYREEDEFLRYGENFIVHREPVEATPYLPNVIVATHPAINPDDLGVPVTATSDDERSGRNIKMAWSEVKATSNFLWDQGYRFYCLTPKSRHRVHSSWAVADWNLLWDSNFTDPFRRDKRMPGIGEHQVHINPDDAKALDIQDGDYVWVDANPEDRPYRGWSASDPLYKVARLKLRARYNSAYPRGVVMIKHAGFMASHKTVAAHESRPDGRAVSGDTGYQANFRYGCQQSVTRGWLQPTMMTDSLVRKNYYGQGIGQGYEIDIHSPNTCPKETLVKVTLAERGGLNAVGTWTPATSGFTPGNESEAMRKYLRGEYLV